MKKIIFILTLAALFFAVSCTVTTGGSAETEKENTENSGSSESGSSENSSSVICPQYFWGKWTRMDNGTEYEIGESTVVCGSQSYAITSKTDISFTCSLGTFTKDTDNVLKIGSIPVFRNGGSNIEYTPLKNILFSNRK